MLFASSPTWTNPFEPPSVSGSFGPGVEFLLSQQKARATGAIAAFWLDICIFSRVFVAPFAMRFGSVFSSISHSTKLKAAGIAEIFLRKGHIEWHIPKHDPIIKSASVNASFSRPFCERLYTSFKCNIDIGLDVVLLLFARCPSAIFWKVPLGAVNAVNRLIWSGKAHIAAKGFKIQPAGTNSYANAPVTIVAAMALIKALPFHAHPDRVQSNYSFNIHDTILASKTETCNGWV